MGNPNDRAGGAMLLYTMLQSGQLVIADTCRNTMRAIESRIHDKKEPTKVEEVLGDPYDDVFDAVRYAVYSYHEALRHARGRAAKESNRSRPNQSSGGLQQDPPRRTERRGATAVFPSRWTAAEDERTRTGTKTEQIKKAVPSLSHPGPQS
jgi:hypothetical protein